MQEWQFNIAEQTGVETNPAQIIMLHDPNNRAGVEIRRIESYTIDTDMLLKARL